MRKTAGMIPQDRFDEVVAELSTVEDVSAAAGGRRYGVPALRRHGRIVAMLSAGRLVVKLPRGRVDELVAAGLGTQFEARPGTPMNQWFVLAEESTLPWPALAKEAVEHARRTTR
jgi:hypothetical protein